MVCFKAKKAEIYSKFISYCLFFAILIIFTVLFIIYIPRLSSIVGNETYLIPIIILGILIFVYVIYRSPPVIDGFLSSFSLSNNFIILCTSGIFCSYKKNRLFLTYKNHEYYKYSYSNDKSMIYFKDVIGLKLFGFESLHSPNFNNHRIIELKTQITPTPIYIIFYLNGGKIKPILLDFLDLKQTIFLLARIRKYLLIFNDKHSEIFVDLDKMLNAFGDAFHRDITTGARYKK